MPASDGLGSVTEPTVFTGQVFKFPFDTQPHDYRQWDDTLGASTTAIYVGTEKVQGVTSYRYQESIPTTVVGTQRVPGSILGSGAADVTARLEYAVERTLWIEPVTGAPLDRTEDVSEQLVHRGHRVPLFIGHVELGDDAVDRLTHDGRRQASALHAVRVEGPLAALSVGLVLIVAGLVVRRRRPSDIVAK